HGASALIVLLGPWVWDAVGGPPLNCSSGHPHVAQRGGAYQQHSILLHCCLEEYWIQSAVLCQESERWPGNLRPLAQGTGSPGKALQVKLEWFRSKIQKDRALRIKPNCRIQTCLDQAFVDPVKCVSQELPVLAEEDPPRGVVQAAPHVVPRSELGTI
ncbi:hypothetical protein THAOC_01670, partial [Thalassiosira oceanica]